MNNQIIRVAFLLSKGVMVLAIVLFFVFVAAVIHWHFDPTFYSRVDVSNCFRPGYGVNDIIYYPASKSLPSDAILLSNLNHMMVYWLLLRGAFFVFLTVAILRKVILILQSLQNTRTFYIGNIGHFRSIASLAFLGFIMSCFNFSYLDNGLQFSFTIAFGPLLLAVASLVLAEIFKEGSQLMEDKNLII